MDDVLMRKITLFFNKKNVATSYNTIKLKEDIHSHKHSSMYDGNRYYLLNKCGKGYFPAEDCSFRIEIPVL